MLENLENQEIGFGDVLIHTKQDDRTNEKDEPDFPKGQSILSAHRKSLLAGEYVLKNR
jgi:hypothetical protein